MQTLLMSFHYIHDTWQCSMNKNKEICSMNTKFRNVTNWRSDIGKEVQLKSGTRN